MKAPAIVLFARSPEREAVAKGMRAAAPLFGAVIRAWLHAAEMHGAMPLIACEPQDRAALARIAPEIERGWLVQRGDRFGARVAAAAADAFAGGFEGVLIAAIDAPPPSDLDRALDALARGRSVIAPARDGGINFIGIARPEPELLARLTPRRRDLVALCRASLGALLVLRVATDIDSPSALAAARREATWRAFLPPSADESPTTPRPRAVPFVRTLPPRAPPQ